MLVRLRFPSLAEFGGAPVALSWPEEISLPTTWLGTDNVPPKGERAKAMELQLDGSWDKEKDKEKVLHKWLTKEEFYALNQRMSVKKKEPDDDEDASDIYLGALDKLKMMSNANVGAMITLSQFAIPGKDPLSNLALVCSAAPSGTANGNAFMLQQHSDFSDQLDTSAGDKELPFLKEAWSHLQPTNVPSPSDVNPVVSILTRNSRATLVTAPDSRQADILHDSLVFTNGLKLTQPACLLLHKDDIPVEIGDGKLFLGPTPPTFTSGDRPFAVNTMNRPVTAANMHDVRTLVFQRALFIPKGHHGIPLGVPFDHSRCKTGQDFQQFCIEFTELPEEAYAWMLDNPVLDTFLAACAKNPMAMSSPTYFMAQLEDSWKDWRAEDTLDSQVAIAHPETNIRFRWMWDYLHHSLTKQWSSKLQQFETKGMAILAQSPDVEEWHKQYVSDAIHLPLLVNPKAKLWLENFHIHFLRQDLLHHWNRFASVDLPAESSADFVRALRIELKSKISGAQSPTSEAKTQRDQPAPESFDILAAMGFSAVATTPLRAPTLAEDEQSRAALSLTANSHTKKRKASLDTSAHKRLGFSEIDYPTATDNDSVDYIGTKPASYSPPRMSFNIPAQKSQTNLSHSKLLLPYEQPHTHMMQYFTAGMALQRRKVDFLFPATNLQTDRFNRQAYVEDGLSDAIVLGAHFGAIAVDPKLRMGQRDNNQGCVFPDWQVLLPGYVSKKFTLNVLESKATGHVTNHFSNELRAAQHAIMETYARPSFASTDFFTTADNIKALQSGLLIAGDDATCSFNAYISPWSFIQTVQRHGHRLQPQGLECDKLAQLTKNMAWYFHITYTNQVRFPFLREIHPELSPWLLASPFAGHLAWLIDLLSNQRLQECWSIMSNDRKLTCTIAVINTICDLWRIIIDWAMSRDADDHCVRVLLHSQQSRSDVCGFKAFLDNHSFESLSDAFTKWRHDTSLGIAIENFAAKELPIAGPFRRPAPLEVQPEKQKQHNDKSSNQTKTSTSGASQQNSSTRAPRESTGTYLKAPASLARWRDGTDCSGAAVRKLFQHLSRRTPPIRAPVFEGKQLCLFHALHGSPGCDVKDCPRHHIVLPDPTGTWTREKLRPLLEFFRKPAVAAILETSAVFNAASS
ncbi:hypothetical protein MPSEU_000115900 [Mayamaea pseudoterrestris]|nr:hypothetical protein MPSEU_000115900 [Mayamaea pseudoterrestris]